MSIKDWPGGYVKPIPPTPAGPYQDSAADGVWTLDQVAYWVKQGLWPIPGNVNPSSFIENIFSTYIYTGNGSTQTITNGINLSGEGGLVWAKRRNVATSHIWIDTVRGPLNYIESSGTSGQGVFSDSLTGFTSSGYTMGNALNYNGSNVPMVSWTFRKQPKFFDIVTYTGDGAGAKSISHSLGSVPGFIMVKRTDSNGDWYVLASQDSNNFYAGTSTNPLKLNSTDGGGTAYAKASYMNATTFNVSAFWNPSTTVNISGATYVVYLFANDAGGFGTSGNENVISCGSFTTDSGGNATVNLGYEPQWLLMKNVDGTNYNWVLMDTMRGWTANTSNSEVSLYPNLLNAETVQAFGSPTATGFNASGWYATQKIIYIAIRRGPMQTPTSGTSVYEAYYDASSLANKTNGSLPSVDFAIQTQAPVPLEGYTWTVFDRLRGNNKYLVTYATSAEATDTSISFTTSQLGVRNATWFSSGGVGYNFKRAPGFFDVVCYTGDASTTARPHNLGVAPELMIFKQRNDGAISWYVYAAPLGNTKYLILDSASGQATASFWNNQTPTSTNFYIRASGFPNEVGGNYVAYLFASCPGVSKVGSYTGNGTSQTINCGFTTGARFILIKETTLASAGNWVVWDYARGIVAGNDPYLTLNTTNSEVTNKDVVDADSTGFIVNETSGPNVNTNGSTYIFLAIS